MQTSANMLAQQLNRNLKISGAPKPPKKKRPQTATRAGKKTRAPLPEPVYEQFEGQGFGDMAQPGYEDMEGQEEQLMQEQYLQYQMQMQQMAEMGEMEDMEGHDMYGMEEDGDQM